MRSGKEDNLSIRIELAQLVGTMYHRYPMVHGRHWHDAKEIEMIESICYALRDTHESGNADNPKK
jgi:hypothetical protein